MKLPKHTITDEQLKALYTEAGHAGDHHQAWLCLCALGGDDLARQLCAEVVADARAMDDSEMNNPKGSSA